MTEEEQRRDDEIRKYLERNTLNGSMQTFTGAYTEIVQHFMHSMQPLVDAYIKAAESVNRSLFRMLYPDAARRQMLREARRRARLSTQRRRKGKATT